MPSIASGISREDLIFLSGLVSRRMGLHFPAERFDSLRDGIVKAAPDFGFSDAGEFINWLKSSNLERQHIEALASRLTVGETYFFREKETFEALEGRILPELIESRRESGALRVWSAGCSTGEEPYSVAILLKRLLQWHGKWNITILATDINTGALKKAARGVYGQWSFRSAPEWVKRLYLTPTPEGEYELSREIRKMVTFAYMNLAEDIFPSLLNNTNAIDLIICRNVLMYFSSGLAQRIAENFSLCLAEGGWLIVNPTEAGPHLKLDKLFTHARFNGTAAYRKKAQGPAETGNETTPPAPPANEDTAADSALRAVAPAAAPAKEPSSAGGGYAKALEMFGRGLYDEAAAALEALACEGPLDRKTAALLARAKASTGRLDEAAYWCEKAVRAEVLAPGPHYLLAAILQEKGLTEEALRSLKNAIYLDGKFIIAYFALGSLLLRLGEAAAAKKHLKAASELLSACEPDDIVPESEGITAARLSEIIDSVLDSMRD
ncbi:MAG: CheR family methyltransferase [Deltaproteobacteria bacterium]|nr:CheR family methyltransferase [Deltaproteobacteria bacterium]